MITYIKHYYSNIYILYTYYIVMHLAVFSVHVSDLVHIPGFNNITLFRTFNMNQNI